MKKNRKLALLMVCVLLVGLLTGCTSAEKVAAKMVENLAGKTAVQASFTMPLDMSVTVAGESMDISLELDGTMWMNTAPYALYAEINYEGDIAEQWLSDQLQVYLAKEDDTYVYYYYSKLGDVWTRMDTGMTDGDMQEYMSKMGGFEGMELDLEKLVLAEETQTVGGAEAYVLSYEITGQMLQDGFDSMGGFSGMLEQAMEQADAAALPEGVDLSAFAALDDLDFTGMSMPITMYVDKSTYALKQVDMQYTGLQGFIDGIVETMMQIVSDMMGQDLSALGLEDSFAIELSDMSMQVTDISFDNVEVKSVPEEGVILGKQASFVPLQEDGSYVLQEYGDAVRVVPIEGQEVQYSDYCTLQLGSADGNASTVYSVLGSDWSEQDLKDYVVSQVDALAEQGLNGTIEDSIVGDYTVQTIKVQGLSLFNAWKQVGDGWIVVEAYHFYNSNQNAVLQNALDAVSAYTLP